MLENHASHRLATAVVSVLVVGVLNSAGCAQPQAGGTEGLATSSESTGDASETGDPESCVELGPERFIGVSVSELHGCAVRESGAVECWGDDEYGKVSGAPCTAFTQVAAGRDQTCGLHPDGTIECWGPPGAIKAPADDDFVAVTSGSTSRHTCGLREGGAIVCWGGSYETDELDPFPAGVYTQVAVSGNQTCGLQKNGVTCQRKVVGEFLIGGDYKRMAATQSDGCTIRQDDTLYCWWSSPAGPPSGSYSEIFGGQDVICALDLGGKPSCFTRDPDDPIGPLIDAEPDVGLSQLSISSDIACGLRGDKTMLCWGHETPVLIGAPAT